jgi:hypothetical protein
VRRVRERSPPGRDEAGQAGEVGAAAALRVRAPVAGLRRGGAHGLGGAPVRRAAKRAQGRRDGARNEAGRSGKRCVQGGLYPRRGCVRRTRRAGAMAPGRMATVVVAPAWALGEAGAVMPAAAVWDGAEDLVVRGGEVGRARKGRRGQGVDESAAGRQAGHPRLRASRRWEAASGPCGVRWRESRGVARCAWPRERGRARRLTPAARSWVAEAWRSVGTPTSRLRRPARGGAWRQAPWTRRRRRGAVAGAMGV